MLLFILSEYAHDCRDYIFLENSVSEVYGRVLIRQSRITWPPFYRLSFWLRHSLPLPTGCEKFENFLFDPIRYKN